MQRFEQEARQMVFEVDVCNHNGWVRHCRNHKIWNMSPTFNWSKISRRVDLVEPPLWWCWCTEPEEGGYNQTSLCWSSSGWLSRSRGRTSKETGDLAEGVDERSKRQHRRYLWGINEEKSTQTEACIQSVSNRKAYSCARSAESCMMRCLMRTRGPEGSKTQQFGMSLIREPVLWITENTEVTDRIWIFRAAPRTYILYRKPCGRAAIFCETDGAVENTRTRELKS